MNAAAKKPVKKIWIVTVQRTVVETVKIEVEAVGREEAEKAAGYREIVDAAFERNKDCEVTEEVVAVTS